jgi:predicted ATPase
MHPSFIDAVANLQRDRQIRAAYQPAEVQFHDRCAVCTVALAIYLGYSLTSFLAGELERLKQEAVFENRVFFVRNLGFATPSAARRITLRRLYVSRKSMKRPTGTLGSNSSSSSQEVWRNGSIPSKLQSSSLVGDISQHKLFVKIF